MSLVGNKGLNSVLFCFSIFILVPHLAFASPGGRYLGVASCASSNCHGSPEPRSGTNVLQNEYATWARFEAHAKAWKTLTNKESKLIAQHLGLKSAETAELCLKCHATYVPNASLRGPKYRVQDGVGCESCHGSSEKWIGEHKAATSSHANNVRLGLKEIVDLKERTKLCLSCHLGTEDQVVDHRLIGAGHPRLGFELDTFSLIQPNHWNVDEDYVQRKGRYNSTQAWFVGQTVRASEMIDVMLSEKRSKLGAMPELSLFYCYSCHHSLEEDQWKSRAYGGRPGELRLNLSSLLVLQEGLEGIDVTLAATLGSLIERITNEFRDGNAIASLREAKALLDGQVMSAVNRYSYSSDSVRGLLKRFAQYSASEKSLQYEIAELCLMAMSAMTTTISPNSPPYAQQIDKLYKAVESEEAFNPGAFSAAASELLRML